MASDKAEEILELLWIYTFEKNGKSISLSEIKEKGNSEIDEIKRLGLIEIAGDNLRLSKKGELEAQDVVRRHRLAERLLADVLDVKGGLLHDSACEFEHLLHKGIDERICRLLGHPSVCPHGSKIPAGKCCAEKKKGDIRVVCPLSELKLGEKGKIAYLQSMEKDKLNKMMAMGVLPGVEIKLIQNFPSYLFKVGNSEFAIDDKIAGEIFVRIEGV